MGREIPTGPTGFRVRANLRALRKATGTTLDQLSERMADGGRPILASGLSKIEQGSRRVDVDDLVALSEALSVNVAQLLFDDAVGDGPTTTPIHLEPEAEFSFTSGIELPDGRRVYADVRIPVSQWYADIGETSEIAQGAAVRAYSWLMQGDKRRDEHE